MTPAHSAALPHLPNDLPVESALAPLRATLSRRRGAVLVAPPGAGKTTIVPLRLRDEPWVNGRRIVMLEPRRLAARAAAQRMAHLLGEDVGQTVGYQTRDERKISDDTRIEVVTEGILTRRLQNDPTLSNTALVIFDEVHERNVPTDLGLALLLNARDTFDTDLRILAMSATPHTEPFAVLLGDESGPADVIESDGRMFEVDIRYVPRQRNDRLENAVVNTVRTALRETEGDVLVFLPGIGEINRCVDALRTVLPADIDIVRLAGALSTAEQDEALTERVNGNRRVVLSTDIAETSLTVAGVRVVVDAGLARVPRFDPRTGLTELTTVTSSRASADQRSGRAGRVAPGVAYRMWSRIEDSTRLPHLPPEITQVDLCNVALELAAWGTPVHALHFIDEPSPRALDLARDTLTMLHLTDGAGHVTQQGIEAMKLPVHPRLATMVVRAKNESADGAWIACVAAALLEERDIMRGRPSDLPSDIALRASIVCGVSSDDRADRGGTRRVLDQARDIARRAGIAATTPSSDVITHWVGELLLMAYPDRLAMRRASAGQFILRGGKGAWVDKNDGLAREGFIVAADLDGDRTSSRVRRGAGLDLDQVAHVLGADLDTESTLVWDKERNDLVVRIVRKIDSLRIDERTMPAQPGDDTTNALLERVVTQRLKLLSWDDTARGTQQRILFLRHHRGHSWPNVSDSALVKTVATWLAPFLIGCTSRGDVERLDVSMLLRNMLSWDQSAELDRAAPSMFTPPHGRARPIDYSEPATPKVSVRVQHIFGMKSHPTVLDGQMPLAMELLSPADRPIQVTSDLVNFWTGSWAQVRKDMAGRYPKHKWPLDPSSGAP